MPSRVFMVRAFSALVFAFSFVLVASPALADSKAEGAAKALEQKAMQEDYLATDFDKALEKLNQASNKCAGDKCSSAIRAQIKVEIGCVQIAGKQNRDAGMAAFVDALKLDSAVKVDDDLRSKEIDSAFAEAKRKVGASAPAAAPPSGDFEMTTFPAQAVRTPLPIFGAYGGSETLTKVVVKYKAFGMTEWKSIEAKSMDKGWGAEIPCADVQQGDLLYYVQGFNANNDPVATSGDRNNPFRTAVKRDFSGDAPHFPGKDPPRQCADAGDCPPDFPGCKKGGAASEESSDSSLKSDGQDCEEDSECSSNTCGSDKTCKGDGSSSGPSKRRIFWIGVAGELDFLHLSSSKNVCLLNAPGTANAGFPVNSSGYYCVDSSGSDFPGNAANNAKIDTNQYDQVQGGFVASGRVMVTFDAAVTRNLLLGARLGYVFNTYTGNAGSKFPPLHLEARGTWVFGADPMARSGVAPYVMVAAGAAAWDGKLNVAVLPVGSTTPANVKAYELSGPGFVGAGVGARFAFNPRVALLLGPKLNLAFGSNASIFAFGIETGLQFGF